MSLQAVLPGLATMLSSPVSIVQFWISQWLPPMSMPSVLGEMFEVFDVGLKMVMPSMVTLLEPLKAQLNCGEFCRVTLRIHNVSFEPLPLIRRGRLIVLLAL